MKGNKDHIFMRKQVKSKTYLKNIITNMLIDRLYDDLKQLTNMDILQRRIINQLTKTQEIKDTENVKKDVSNKLLPTSSAAQTTLKPDRENYDEVSLSDFISEP